MTNYTKPEIIQFVLPSRDETVELRLEDRVTVIHVIARNLPDIHYASVSFEIPMGQEARLS